MGEVAAAAVVAHVPTIMLPEQLRVRIGGTGADSTLIAGLRRLREHLTERRVDTLLIVDTHWFTTLDHVIAGAPHHHGLFTSDELPNLIQDHPFDYAGAPELAERITEVARERSVPVTNTTTASLPRHYPTINLVHWLHQDEQVLSVGVCQTAQAEDFLALGNVVGEAVTRTDRRLAILASGGMSHHFWPLQEQRAHGGFDPSNVSSDRARAADCRILDAWEKGDHASVVDFYSEYRECEPEGFFGHYLILLGAIGGRDCRAVGNRYSEYENAAGTGQVHVVFDVGSESQ